jgi:ribosome-associated protein
MTTIEINKEPVELYKILKFEGLAESGGHAKAMIDAELVLVNGTIETQKRKKIVSGDILTIDNNTFQICLA